MSRRARTGASGSIAQVCADRGIAPGGTKGAARHLAGVAAALTRRGHRVETYAARPAEGAHPAPVVALADLDTAVAEGRVDLVYERYSLGHRHGLDLAHEHGRPFVLEVNAPLVAEATAHRPDSLGPDDERVEHDLLAAADVVVAVSHPLADWVAGHRGHRRGVLVVPNGFDHDQLAGVEPVAGDRPVLGFCGHPKPWHGADRLVDVLGALDARGIAADLLVVGGGPGAADVAAAADRAGLADRVEITGPVDPAEVARHLGRMTVALAPYRSVAPDAVGDVGFYFCPLKVVEYLAAGLASVVSDVGDVRRLVDDTAVVVDADDDAALVDAVAALVVDPDARRRLGDRARRRARRHLTWDRVLDGLDPLLTDLLAGVDPVAGPGIPGASVLAWGGVAP